MFLPSGADNPSYATTSAGQCQCGRFSLLYREQERPLLCQPIVRRRLTAGLGSPVPGVWGPVGDCVPRRAARLRVDTSATAPETRPLPAPILQRRQRIVQRRPTRHTHGMIGCNMTAVDQGDCCSSVECSSVVCSFCAIRGISIR